MNRERRVSEILMKTVEVGPEIFPPAENKSPVREIAEKIVSNAGEDLAAYWNGLVSNEINYNLTSASLLFGASLISLEDTISRGQVDAGLIKSIFEAASGRKMPIDYEGALEGVAELDYREYNENLVFTAQNDKTFVSFFENERLMPQQILAVLKKHNGWWEVIKKDILPAYKEMFDDKKSAGLE